MLEQIEQWVAVLGLDWGLVGLAASVLVVVYVANAAGLTKTGDSKRLAGVLVSAVLASAQLLIAGLVPNEEVALWLFNAFSGWLLAALGYEGLEALVVGIKAKKG